jgi:predicted nucleic acid-binding protein
VLAELSALLLRLRMAKAQQIQLFDELYADPSVEVVHIDPTLEAAARQLWKSRPDKEWTLVDCASFVVMQKRSLMEAITSDHHFEQAGFVRLLK